MVRRIGRLAFAGLITVFGLAMANVAGFYALQATAGSIWAAVIVGFGDFTLAAILMLVARNSQPGREIELAFEVRNVAIASIEADAHDLKVAIDALGREIRDAKESIVRVLPNPLDVAVQKLLIPAAISIIRGLRSRKAEG